MLQSKPGEIMRPIGLDEAAALLRISPDAMREFAAEGVIPGAKIGKEWVFLDADLIEYLKTEIKNQTSQRRGKSPERVKTAYARTVRHKPANPPELHQSSMYRSS